MSHFQQTKSFTISQQARQQLADLRWIVDRPPLVDTTNGLMSEGDLIDWNGADLPPFAGQRVGRYFESLLHFLLKDGAGHDIIAAGQTVQDGTRTLGELDFVFRNRIGELCHLEVAIKFYLAIQQPNQDGHSFLGPNSRDSFEKKIDKMLQKQIPLGKQCYPDLQRQAVLMHGIIFENPLAKIAPPFPSELAEDHQRGQWIHQSQHDWLDTFPDSVRFLRMVKPHWLSPAIDGNSRLFSARELQVDILRDPLQRAVMLSVLDQKSTRPVETERLIIVPDQWPEQ